MSQEHHTEDYADIRDAVAKLCSQFPGEYWRKLDREMAYPKAFVDALTEAGYLSVLIPEEYGGAGLKLSAAAAILEEIQRAGCNGGGCHAQMYTMGTVLRHGNDEQKAKYLPKIASGELRLQAFGVTEPTSGTDTSSLKTFARKDGNDSYIVNGQKIWTSRAEHSDLMILLARTNPDAQRKYDGLSFFLAPMTVPGVDTVPIRKLTGEYGFTQTFFTDARIPATTLMGGEGKGWQVAMRTLEYERGARGGQAGGYVMVYPDVSKVVDLAKRAMRNGRPAFDDPAIRERLVKLLTTYRGLKLNSTRALIAPLVRDRPLSLPLSAKLVRSEFYREINQLAMAMQGPHGAYYVGEPEAYDDAIWQRSYLNSFSATIGGGTSQIQHNIIGEHVLGLPKS